jgi:hypothetical protein
MGILPGTVGLQGNSCSLAVMERSRIFCVMRVVSVIVRRLRGWVRAWMLVENRPGRGQILE